MTESERLAERLKRARVLRRWSEVLAVADQLRGLVPPADPATLLPETAKDPAPDSDPASPWTRFASLLHLGDRFRGVTGEIADSNPRPIMSLPANRFLMWVDAVGGYLVCTHETVVLGQPDRGGGVDVPLLGDLSRRHAAIHRDIEGYLIEPFRTVRINGRKLERTAPLADGQEIELGGDAPGAGVRLRFRRPHPLSLSARLDRISFHRTQPATDGVLLFADACILGPAATSHVVCPNWKSDLVLHRTAAGLAIRSTVPVSIDSGPVLHRGPLGPASRVTAPNLSITFEPLGA